MKHKLLLALLLAASALGCQNKKVVTSPDPAFAQYIKAYTGGIVAPGTALRVELNEPVPEDRQITEGLFSFSPQLRGTVVWNTPTQVSFHPDENAMESGKTYAACFQLGKVTDVVQPNLREFRYGFAVRGEAGAYVADDEIYEGDGFHIRSATLAADGERIDLVFSAAPANAATHGLIELRGVRRSYIQVTDTLVRVYFDGRSAEDMVLTVDKAVKDNDGNALGSTFTKTFRPDEPKPAVQISIGGGILPDKERLLLPFRAVNLSAVEVRIVKIYENNVLSYLQDNDLGEEGSLRRSGRLIYRGDIPLDASLDLHKWNDHVIDLSGLLKKEPGAIYRIRLNFRLDQSLYGGKSPMMRPGTPSGTPTAEDDAAWDVTSPYYWDNDFDWENYDWRESEDPEKPSYYMDSDRFPSIMLMTSEIGLVTEYAGGDKVWVAATDLLDASPLPGARLEVYDYQLQKIAEGRTDRQGLAELSVSHKPFVVVARSGNSVSYLKMTSAGERSMSRFDVGGEVLSGGLKAFIYGERGVWRPGDTIHLSAIVARAGAPLPDAHPATLELYTPSGQFYRRLVGTATDGFYSFDIQTSENDPTGYWNAYFKLGGSSFHKTLNIETVKPNRFRIETSIGSATLQAGEQMNVQTSASWLAGGPASNSPVRATMTLRPVSNPFPGFDKYSFSDPSSNFTSTEMNLYSGKLDGNGFANLRITLPEASDAPGMLNAFVVTSVQEPGGDESFTTQSVLFSPYSSYVGIKVPDGDYLETDTDQTVSLAVLDADGHRVHGHKIEYAVFKTGWNWWWDNPGGSLSAYISGSSVELVGEGELTSGSNSDASFSIRVNYPDWGRYLILARDKSSGHTSGRMVTIDWPLYRGRASRRDPESLTMLSFSTSKTSYQVGEQATVYIPAAAGGHALVSLENSTGVIERRWVETSANGDTPYQFNVTPAMAPNFYVHITLVQPYGNNVNDLPLRLYGVQRLRVENPASHLEPQLVLPDVIHPEEDFTVRVSEKSGRTMTYTLAIVDEGLLDLTAFRTPDPWEKMNRPEALGVRTWDLFDQVVGAWTGGLAPLASIGGDQDNVVSARKDNRFNPVVMYLPPKTLTRGTDVLTLRLPQYVGSVRVMLVAAHDGAYGNADATVPVQAPLMLVTTLPRVLGPGEEISLPVNVFAMDERVKNASVSVAVDGPLEVQGPATRTVQTPSKGDYMVEFRIKAVEGAEGTAHVNVSATGATFRANESLAIPVRNPNPATVNVESFTLNPGESHEIAAGTLQVATFPAFNANALYRKMRGYPYDCTEQLASRGLTALSLLPLLDEATRNDARAFIPTLISSIYSRQGADGGFSYWGGGASGSWESSLAGLFLSKAAQEGFEVNEGVISNWLRYQRRMSQAYRIAGNSVFTHLDECFRLYTLAASGNADVAGMNRMREADGIGYRAKWMLASAYALAGKGQIAGGIIQGIDGEFEEYAPNTLTYATPLRDKMNALEAFARCGILTQAMPLAREVALVSWFSTQEAAFASMALRALYEIVGDDGIDITLGQQNHASAGAMLTLAVDAPATLRNNSSSTLSASLVSTSVPAPFSVTPARSNGSLQLELRYLDDNGHSLNPASLPQGTLFRAVVKVTNRSQVQDLENLALTVPIASGWEIQNKRLTGGESEGEYDHKDIRDDRVDFFFALPHGRSKTFTVQMRAVYEGRYVLPATSCSAMYDATQNASTASGTAVVTR